MQARLSLDLVTLKDDVPIEVTVEQMGVRDPEPPQLLGFLREMEFATLTKRIAEGLGAEAPPPVERPAGGSAGRSGTPVDNGTAARHDRRQDGRPGGGLPAGRGRHGRAGCQSPKDRSLGL